ncbi:MAG: ATP synthase F1 subunit delta [Vicinamibacteria bacterium]
MSNRPIAARYANALFEIARASGRPEAVAEELEKIKGALAPGSESWRLLTSPAYSLGTRKRMLAALVEAMQIRSILPRLLEMLVDGGRLEIYAEMADEFRKIRDEAAGRVTARVRTAKPLREEDLSALGRALGRLTGKEVRLEVTAEPALIAGIVAEVGDRIYDGSLRSGVEKLRRLLAGA